MRPTRDQWAMSLAQLTAMRATCCRRQVGAVLLNERGHVLATGYNGVAAGLPHCNEVTDEVVNPDLAKGDGTYRVAEHWERATIKVHGHACSGATAPSGQSLDSCQAIHAEQNAMLQCRDVYAIHTAYVTASPCMTCTKLLLNTGCQRIVFLEEYPHPEAKALWESSGRVWCKLEADDLIAMLIRKTQEVKHA
jgi:dCMP deaminase